MYNITYTAQAVRSIRQLDRSIQVRLKKAIEDRLMVSPEIYGKPLKYSLKGLRSLRVGDYRIIYCIERRRVVVADVGHRREIYNEP